MSTKDMRIIIGILGAAAVMILVSTFLMEYTDQILPEDSIPTPEEEIEDTPEKPKVFYHYEESDYRPPQPEGGDIFRSNGLYTLKTGECLDLGNGYLLEAKLIDSEGAKVWMEVTRNGEFVDDEIIPTSDCWELELNSEPGKTIRIYVEENSESQVVIEVQT